VTLRQPPPIQNAMIDESGVATLPWVLFFNGVYSGDNGTDWTPAFTSLTETGTATFTGKYYKINDIVTYFTAVITPGTNTSSVAGTTYINNFPLSILSDGTCFAVAGNAAAGPGAAIRSSGRIYTPAWTSVTVPVTVSGLILAR
jgi:hypothetical protein